MAGKKSKKAKAADAAPGAGAQQAAATESKPVKRAPKAAAKPAAKAATKPAAKPAAKTKAAGKPTAKPRAKPAAKPKPVPFNILIVAQAGPLQYQALLFAASLRQSSPDWKGRLIVAVPEEAGAWQGRRTALAPEVATALQDLGAEITPFTAQHFGAGYPQGNKIEALACLPAGQPFIFFDTDTLITAPLDQIGFDFDRPAASMRRSNTWPEPPLYGPGYGEIWKSLYDRFGLDFAASLDPDQPDEHWERYLYFNAGWFFGADPQAFGQRFCDWARAVRDEPGDALACQSLDPWLDQVVLPLVVHSFGGGRPGPELAALDGAASCHYRHLGLLYGRESDATVDALEQAAAPNRVKKHLRDWPEAKLLIYRGMGRKKARPLGQDNPPERGLRKRLRDAGLWAL